jgi:hypothetical protein
MKDLSNVDWDLLRLLVQRANPPADAEWLPEPLSKLGSV